MLSMKHNSKEINTLHKLAMIDWRALVRERHLYREVSTSWVFPQTTWLGEIQWSVYADLIDFWSNLSRKLSNLNYVPRFVSVFIADGHIWVIWVIFFSLSS